ncbi:MAG: hypothetical protein IKT42_05215 [Clostridia bacterium]|nr:hypothetical protein [Clostridia bacterium]
MDRTHKIILSVLAVLFVGIITACVIVVSQPGGNEQIYTEFVAPAFDKNATVIETSDIPQSAQYKPLVVKEGFKIAMSSEVTINDDVIEVYFTSDKNNVAWLKIEILSADGTKFYGESGLIKQGETLKQLKLDSLPEGESLIVKVLSYEPDTYYSLGTAKVTVTIKK